MKNKKVEIEWHPYPQEKPLKCGKYRVSIKTARGSFTFTTWLSIRDLSDGFWDKYLIAWAELPESYKE